MEPKSVFVGVKPTRVSLFLGILFSLFCSFVTNAQTTGEVLFVGFNADGNDGFSFVTLVSIPNNTNIRFNDNEWNGAAFDADADGGTPDGSLTWNNNTGAAIAASTVVTINNSSTTPAASVGTTSGGTINLRNQNEVLYMFIGTTASLPTTFLSAIANDGFSVANGTLPAALTTGTNALSIAGDDDVMVYNGSTNCNTTIAACATMICTAANWATQDTGANDATNGFPDFPTDVDCGFFGVAMYPIVTYYSRASGAWDLNTSWSLSADGSTGAVPVGVWPRRTDNVVIRSGHNITINAIDDNKTCGISPDGLGRTGVVGNYGASPIAMFYQIGDILISGTLTVSGIEMMIENYTKINSTGSFILTSSLVNIGYLEADASSTFTSLDDLILDGLSTTIVNTNSLSTDDLIISRTSATLCGTGVTTLQNGAGSVITYANGATVAQICTSYTVNCTGVGCAGFPVVGTGVFLLGNVGPGGVGNSSNNRLWLRASDLTLANGAAVASWADVSGNGLTATNATAGERPTFVTPSVNGLPSLSFDGTTDNLSLGAPAALNFVPQTNSWSFFIAYNAPVNGATTIPNQGTLFSKAYAAPEQRNYQYQIDDNAGTSYFSSYIGNGTLTLGTVATNTGNWIISSHTNNTTTRSAWSNEGATFTGVAVSPGSDAATEVLIGARRDTGPANGTEGFRYTGNIAEIAMYSREVNAAQRIIISNYLSAKYAVALTANDVYTMDNAVNGNFDYEVAGIGQAADGSNHKDGRGSGIVRMWNPNALGNSEYLMWGHNGAILYSSTTGDVDGGIIEERLSRIWRVGESADVGTVSVSFDISTLGTPLGSNLRLLIDRDGDGFGDNDVTPIAGTFANNVVVFSGINFQNGDRFTLGNLDLTDPLPIELLGFRATPQNQTVRINWATASEIDNDFFTVERSKDAQRWEPVAKVAGAGTSQLQINYEIVDDGPYDGPSYYRLKQTDFDKKTSYSKIVRVVVDYETPLVVYPNPFDTNFKLVADFRVESDQARLYNSSGKEVLFKMQKEGDEIIIDPGTIPQGLYILKITDGFVNKTIKVIKK